MIRVTFAFVILIQVVAWLLALAFVWALIFHPELIGSVVTKVIIGFQKAMAGAA